MPNPPDERLTAIQNKRAAYDDALVQMTHAVTANDYEVAQQWERRRRQIQAEMEASALTDIAYLLAEVTRLTQQREEAEKARDAWKDAVIDAAVVNWTYLKAHETDPRAAINALMAQVQLEALDPAISAPAAALVTRAEAAEAALAEARKAEATYGIAFGRLQDESPEQHVAAIKACYDAEHAKALQSATRTALLQAAEELTVMANTTQIDKWGLMGLSDVAKWLTARAKESGA